MIEIAMIAALGALAATLLFLLFLPLVNRRAHRLALRQLEWRLPLTPAEISAERDRLRGEIALRERQAEQQVELALNARQSAEIETGRKLIELHARQETIQLLQGEIREKSDEADELTAQLAARDARILDIEAALAAEQAKAMALTSTLDGVVLDLQASTKLNDERRVEIASLHAQSAAQQLRIGDAEADLSRTRDTLQDRSEQLRGLERTLRDARSEIETITQVRLRAEAVAEERLAAIRLLEQKRDQLLIERDQLQAELARESRTRKTLENDIDRRGEALQRLESELAAVRNAGVQTSTELAMRMGELSAERQARKAGDQALREVERRFAAAETRHAASLQAKQGSETARTAALQNELDRAMQREAALQHKLDHLTRQMQGFEAGKKGKAQEPAAPSEAKPRTAARNEPAFSPPPASNDSAAVPEADPRSAIAEMRLRLRKKLEQGGPQAAVADSIPREVAQGSRASGPSARRIVCDCLLVSIDAASGLR